MYNFQIQALSTEDFQHLFDDTVELKKLNGVKMIATEFPGFPCRVSLTDAEIGEEVILLPYEHHPDCSPYQAVGPIFIKKNAQTAQLAPNNIPPFLNHRFLSLRAYDASGMMLNAVTEWGTALPTILQELFTDSRIEYIHIHNANPGCFNCTVQRVNL